MKPYSLYFNHDHLSVELSENLSFSLKSVEVNSQQILCIFSWEQTVFTWYRKNRCVLIKYSPYIKWIQPNNHQKDIQDTNIEDDGREIISVSAKDMHESMESMGEAMITTRY